MKYYYSVNAMGSYSIYHKQDRSEWCIGYCFDEVNAEKIVNALNKIYGGDGQ